MEKIYVFIYDGMADYQISFVSHLLSEEVGKELITISYDNNLVKGQSGIMYKSNKTVKEVVNEDAAGLIIPGGYNLEVRNELIDLIISINNKNKLLAAICSAPRLLAKSGILDKVRYTTSALPWTDTLKEKFRENNPFPIHNYVCERVVRDNNVITAQGVAFVDFAIEICDWFRIFESIEEKKDFFTVIRGI